MARTNRANGATAEGGESTPKTNGATAEGGESTPKTKAPIMLSVPIELKELVDAEAERRGTPTASYVRQLLAETFKYTLPPVTRARRSKYTGMTEEQKAAAKADEKRKYKALLAAVRAGDASIDEILRKYAQPEAEAQLEPEAVPA